MERVPLKMNYCRKVGGITWRMELSLVEREGHAWCWLVEGYKRKLGTLLRLEQDFFDNGRRIKF